MGQDHRKTIYKLNGKKIMEEQNPHNDTKMTPEPIKTNVKKNTSEIGFTSHDDSANDDHFPGKENRRDVINLSEKRKEWAARDGASQSESPGLPLHRKKKKMSGVTRTKQGWPFHRLKVPVIIMTALIVGLMFGLPLLQLATNFSLTSSAGTSDDTSGEQAASTAVDEEERDALQVDIVQAGAFSTDEAGEEIKDVFSDAGFPALLHEEDDMTYLYVGMTDHGEAEDEIMPQLTAEGLEGYVKTLSIPIASNGLDEETEQLANNLGEALLAGLEATGTGDREEDAESALTTIDLDSVEQHSGEASESFLQAIQTLHEEENVEKHEVWMEAALAYEDWVERLE